MPFKVFKDVGSCSMTHPFAVFTVDANGNKQGTPKGCHPTEADAQKQVAALYANVPEARR